MIKSLAKYGNATRTFSTGTTAVLSRANKVGSILLNRPKALNALDLGMIKQITPTLLEWQKSGDVQCVVMKGEGGKAFCAGGDIVSVRKLGVEGRPVSEVADFFRQEYHLNYLLATATTPQVSILNGITMGGGVGLSVHGKYRVATDNTLFAMPETTIGFFPDVGGSHFLPKLDGKLGMYLALTGDRLKGRDVFEAGVATHFVAQENMEAFERSLANIENSEQVEGVINEFSENKTGNAGFTTNQDKINSCFAGDSLEEIVDALKSDSSEWSLKHAKTLERVSPFALKVTHRMLKESTSKSLSIADCLKMEYRIANRFMADGEFFEGVRALLIDKDQTPVWKEKTLAEVSEERVERCFTELDVAEEGPELEL